MANNQNRDLVKQCFSGALQGLLKQEYHDQAKIKTLCDAHLDSAVQNVYQCLAKLIQYEQKFKALIDETIATTPKNKFWVTVWRFDGEPIGTNDRSADAHIQDMITAGNDRIDALQHVLGHYRDRYNIRMTLSKDYVCEFEYDGGFGDSICGDAFVEPDEYHTTFDLWFEQKL